jgi:hypothetical protein
MPYRAGPDEYKDPADLQDQVGFPSCRIRCTGEMQSALFPDNELHCCEKEVCDDGGDEYVCCRVRLHRFNFLAFSFCMGQWWISIDAEK